jgi:hypothetical protein
LPTTNICHVTKEYQLKWRQSIGSARHTHCAAKKENIKEDEGEVGRPL